MIFNSFTFILFLAVFVVLYWNLSQRLRLTLLLVASIVFYGFWNFNFVPILFLSIVVDYTASLMIHRTDRQLIRKVFLWLSLVTNFSLLGFFKYYYFFGENAVVVGQIIGMNWNPVFLNVVLPIGASFYTFQSVSYTIDVYRRQIQPIRDFMLFANYVTFFPQLVAGPILRAGEVVWQLEKRPAFKPNMVKYGIARILGGIAMKVLLADNIASSVNVGFDADPLQLSAIDVSTLAFLFGFQIYFDFAAYSHIAIGSACLMGISFPENFNFPYLARSPKDFWRRWHISLSSWIRDYLYLPLMGLRGGDTSTSGIGQRIEISSLRSALALFATWAIMGLWHGAAWTFVLWGLWHASIIFAHRIITKMLNDKALPRAVVWMGSLLSAYLIMLGWIPFRAESIPEALDMLEAFVDPSRWVFMGLRENTYLAAAVMGLFVLIGPLSWYSLHALYQRNSLLSNLLLWLLTSFLIAASLIYLRPLEQFIYFQF